MLRVHSYETMGTHEGPGLRFVIFLQGCHFRCLYCHNPDTWSLTGGCQTELNEILARIESVQPYFGSEGGVTVSGGEPLLQRAELLPLFKIVRKNGIHTALDTNGSVLDAMAKQLIDETDLVLLDIKHINESSHKKLTTASNVMPLRFAAYLEEIGKPFWIRYVLVPGYSDSLDDVKQLGRHFESYDYLQRIEILPYHTYGMHKYKALNIPYPLEGVTPPTNARVDEVRYTLNTYIHDVRVR